MRAQFVSRFLLVIACLFASTSTFAGDVVTGRFGPKKSAPTTDDVLTFQLYLGPNLVHVLPELKNAVVIVGGLAPDGVRLEGTSKPDYDFVLEVTDPISPESDLKAHRSVQGMLQALTADVESYTTVMDHAPNGPYVVRIFWDRLVNEVRDGRSVVRQDALARLVVALGREVYGAALAFKKNRALLSDPKHRYSTTEMAEDQRLFERAKLDAGIEIAKRFESMTRLNPDLQYMNHDAKNALAKEQLRFARWQTRQAAALSAAAGPAVTPIGSRCESLFKPRP